MSRGNKWSREKGRQPTGRRLKPAQYVGRLLRFECCEARIALSTNALGEWTLTIPLRPEGGFIELDASASYDHVSSSFPASTNAVSDSAISVSGVPRTDWTFQVIDTQVDAAHGLAFDDYSPSGNNVRLIAPLVAPQHSEGGQIALINLPSAAMAGLAAVSPHVTAKADREPPPAAESKVGPRVVNEAGGLRSRAIAFEVADAKPAGVQPVAVERAAAPRVSPQLVAFNDELSDAPARSEQRPGRSDAQTEADARRQRTHVKENDQLVETELAPTPTLREDSANSAVADLEHAAIVGNGAADSTDANAARDVAWSELRQHEAPLGDSASTSVDVRGRRVLALALALTAGSAPLGRFLRRGTPQKGIEQRPPRRRWPRLF